MNLQDTPRHYKVLLPVIFIEARDDHAAGGGGVDEEDPVVLQFNDHSYMADDIFISSGLEEQQVAGCNVRKW